MARGFGGIVEAGAGAFGLLYQFREHLLGGGFVRGEGYADDFATGVRVLPVPLLERLAVVLAIVGQRVEYLAAIFGETDVKFTVVV
ncbi:MAG: hypothetical protein ACRCZF_24440, partial [Gemmataceae bacterium]